MKKHVLIILSVILNLICICCICFLYLKPLSISSKQANKTNNQPKPIVKTVNKNEIVDKLSKLNLIIHPSIFEEPKKPLIIDYQVNSGDTIERKKEIYYPMIYEEIYVNNQGIENKENKATWTLFYDAFAFPNKKGYVLVKLFGEWEAENGFQEIKIRDLENDRTYKLKPNGSDLFISKDYKTIITYMSDFDPYNPPKNPTYKLFYYDLNDTNELIKPSNTVTVSEEELNKLDCFKIMEH